jgi:hypothetical protein
MMFSHARGSNMSSHLGQSLADLVGPIHLYEVQSLSLRPSPRGNRASFWFKGHDIIITFVKIFG